MSVVINDVNLLFIIVFQVHISATRPGVGVLLILGAPYVPEEICLAEEGGGELSCGDRADALSWVMPRGK